jgi:hypothetical protein
MSEYYYGIVALDGQSRARARTSKPALSCPAAISNNEEEEKPERDTARAVWLPRSPRRAAPTAHGSRVELVMLASSMSWHVGSTCSMTRVSVACVALDSPGPPPPGVEVRLRRGPAHVTSPPETGQPLPPPPSAASRQAASGAEAFRSIVSTEI